MKFNRICCLESFGLPSGDQQYYWAAGLFSKGEGPQAGGGKAWGLSQLRDLNQQVTSLDLSVLFCPFQP